MSLPPTSSTTDPRWQAPLLVLAAFALGQAVQIANGNLHPRAIACLMAAALLVLAAIVLPGHRLPESLRRWLEPVTVGLIAVLLVWQLAELFTTRPGIYLQMSRAHHLRPFNAGLVVAAIAVVAGLGRQAWRERYALPALLLAVAGLGAWMIHTSPDPAIDVFVFQQEAVDALFQGNNPYAMTIPDIYGNPAFYGEGYAANGVLQFGFPYPPVCLWLVALARVFSSDVRYAQLGAILGAALLMALSRPSRLSFAATALFLTTPRTFFVLEQGWTDPFVVLGVAAVVFAACRAPRALPWCLGPLFAVKQYLVLAVPLVWLLLPRPLPRGRDAWRWLGKVVIPPALVSLPLALWDPAAFLRDVVGFHLHQPFRSDALSFLAFWADSGGPKLPAVVGFVAAGLGWLLAYWRCPRTPSGFALGVAVTFLGFFAFNKQAFCNYYYFIIAVLCLAVAALPTVRDEPSAAAAAAGSSPS